MKKSSEKNKICKSVIFETLIYDRQKIAVATSATFAVCNTR